MALRKALMICGNYWSSPFQVGSQHIARSLTRYGWEIAYVSAPISPFHLLGRTDLRQRFEIYRKGGITDLDGHLWAYVPGTVFAPSNKFFLQEDWVHRTWWRFSIPNLVAKVKAQGFGSVDLLYLDSFIQPFWLEQVKYRKSVFRVMDYFEAFGVSSPSALESQKEIIKRVDLVVYSAKSLEAYVASFRGQKEMFLPNGVNYAHFAEDRQGLPVEYGKIPRPIAVYTGAIDFWFDFGLVEYAARRMPEVSFVLIGPADLARTRMERLPNLYLLGRRSYQSLPPYVRYADVGIIPLNVTDYPALVNHVHPLKLYEYMACGLPVVAVAWDELRNINSPASLSHNPEEFVQRIHQALEQPGDPIQNRSFAGKADWMSRVAALVEELDL